MGRVLSLFAFAILILLLLAVGAILALPLLPVDRFAERIEAEIERATGLPVQLNGTIRLAAVPEVKFDLRDFVIEATDPNLPPLAQANAAAIALNTGDLLRREITVTKLRLADAEVNLQLSKSGGLAGLPDFGKGGQSESGLDVRPEDIKLSGVSLERGKFRLADPNGVELVSLENINAAAALEGMNSPFRLDVSAEWKGTPLSFNGTVSTVERFLNQQVAGLDGSVSFADAQAFITGDMDLATGEPALLGWEVRAKGPNLAGLLQRVGVEAPVDPALLAGFDANIAFDYDAGLFSAPRFDASLSDMRVSAPIQAILSPSGRMTFETLEAVKLTEPSLNRWMQGMALGLPSDPEVFGATRLQASLSGSIAPDGVLTFRAQDTTASVGSQSMQFDRMLVTAGDGFFAGATLEGLALNVPSVRRVLQTFDAVPPGIAPDALGALSVSGDARFSDSDVAVSDALITLDNQSARGSASIFLDAVPTITANLTGGTLDLTPYINLEGSSAQQRQQVATASDPSAPWGTEPIDVSGLRLANAQINASIDGLDLGITRFGPSKASVVLEDGIFQAQVDETSVYRGAARGRILIDGRTDVPAMSAQLQATAVQAGDILRDFVGIEFLEGSSQTNINLTTRGRTMQDWMANMNGNVGSELSPSALKGWDIPRLVEGMKAGNLLQSSTANFFIGNQFATVLERLGATGNIQNGVLRHEDFFARTQALTIKGGGLIDLARQQLDYGLSINVNDGGLVVPIRVVGSWDKPQLTIDGPALLEWLKGNPDILSTIAGIWDLDKYLPEGASVASLEAEARNYIQAEAQRVLTEAREIEQQIEQAVIDERDRIAQQLNDEAARQRALLEQQAAQLEAQLQAQREALEAQALRELQAAQEQVLTSRRQLQQQLEEETNRAVQDGLNALGLGGLLGN
ncbi:MAG: AsmA family protein [Alphaproteobacteria bacterium]